MVIIPPNPLTISVQVYSRDQRGGPSPPRGERRDRPGRTPVRTGEWAVARRYSVKGAVTTGVPTASSADEESGGVTVTGGVVGAPGRKKCLK